LGSDISENERKQTQDQKKSLQYMFKLAFKKAWEGIFKCQKVEKKKKMVGQIKKVIGMKGLKINIGLKTHPMLKYSEFEQEYT
jgi:hypothetical protein